MDTTKKLTSEELEQVAGGWQPRYDMDTRELWEHLKNNPVKLDMINLTREQNGLPRITKEYIDSLNV